MSATTGATGVFSVGWHIPALQATTTTLRIEDKSDA